jgi:hypothetical protein
MFRNILAISNILYYTHVHLLDLLYERKHSSNALEWSTHFSSHNVFTINI